VGSTPTWPTKAFRDFWHPDFVPQKEGCSTKSLILCVKNVGRHGIDELLIVTIVPPRGFCAGNVTLQVGNVGESVMVNGS
jgi:hypothetical protein